MELNFWSWLLSLSPILVVLVLMLAFKWGGMRAGAFSWVLTIVTAFAFFGATPLMFGYAQVKALLVALDVLTIVWGSLLLLNIANEAGAIQRIGQVIPALSRDKGIQVLLIAWMLTTFLQGMGGFGVPVAIAAPILVALGYTPLTSIVMSALGHSWSVTFGVMAAAFNALIGVTGVSKEVLASPTATLLGLTIIPAGLLIAYLGGGWRGVRHLLPAITIVGFVMGLVQFLFAVSGLETLAATGAVIFGTATLLLVSRLPLYRRQKTTNEALTHAQIMNEPSPTDSSAQKRSTLVLISPYIFVIFISFSIALIRPLNNLLNQLRFSLTFPEILTNLGWRTAAGEGKSIEVFSHPGMLMVYTCLFAIAIYGLNGYFTFGSAKRVISQTLHGLVNTSLGVIAMVSIATIMSHTGMTNLLARGISETINRVVYPFIVPYVGVLGAFLTGSNNNSNVLFASLHQEAARMMGLSIPWILAAQTAGGSLGSVMSPAKIMVGALTVGLVNQEGLILRKLIGYILILVTIVSLAVTLILAFVVKGAGQ